MTFEKTLAMVKGEKDLVRELNKTVLVQVTSGLYYQANECSDLFCENCILSMLIA
jgi:hypothetical protein